MSYINTINNADTNYLIAGVSNIIICSTSASTVAKTATAMDGFSLDSNLSFKIIFTNGNTASSPTLNLNDTGAKSLTTTTSNYTLVANMLYDCYYNGTSYVLDNTVTVHTANTSNPHSVTKAQVGLGNCDNTADADKAVKSATLATSASKLTFARKTYVTLGTASTSTTRDWSGDTTIPVSGTLPVANGGTGTTSLSNITVGNSAKLYGYSVQTSSIGGSSTETTEYWTYVTKSKFTSTGGYIKYSNGLLIQWGTSKLQYVSIVPYTSTNSYRVFSHVERNTDYAHYDQEEYFNFSASQIYRPVMINDSIAYLTIGYQPNGLLIQWGKSPSVNSSETVSIQCLSMTFVSGACTVYGTRENTGSIVSFNDSNGVLVLRNTYSGDHKGSGQLFYIIIGY